MNSRHNTTPRDQRTMWCCLQIQQQEHEKVNPASSIKTIKKKTVKARSTTVGENSQHTQSEGAGAPQSIKPRNLPKRKVDNETISSKVHDAGSLNNDGNQPVITTVVDTLDMTKKKFLLIRKVDTSFSNLNRIQTPTSLQQLNDDGTNVITHQSRLGQFLLSN